MPERIALRVRGARTTLDAMAETMPTKHWTRLEYDRLIEKGVFGSGERLELLGGLLVVREPQGGPHAMGIRMVEEALRRIFTAGWDVRGQLPRLPAWPSRARRADRGGGRVEPEARSWRKG